MEEETKNRPGARAGNQNARKHGFYSEVIDENQQQDLEQAIAVEGLDEEIALLRVKIKALVRKDPDNIKLIARAVESMAKVVRIKYALGLNEKTTLKDTVANLLKDVAFPVGMSIANILKKG